MSEYLITIPPSPQRPLGLYAVISALLTIIVGLSMLLVEMSSKPVAREVEQTEKPTVELSNGDRVVFSRSCYVGISEADYNAFLMARRERQSFLRLTECGSVRIVEQGYAGRFAGYANFFSPLVKIRIDGETRPIFVFESNIKRVR